MRNGQLGVLIRRQQPLLGRFVADFYWARGRVCIEIDGDSHAEQSQAAYDEARTAALLQRGYRVLRFTNADVAGDLRTVLAAIPAASEPPSPLPSP
jgi:very-short-patch-repair endonuclease